MTAPYATLTDLYAVMPLSQMGRVSVARQQAILDARNDYADSKFRARYRLPLGTPYPKDLVLHICYLASRDVAFERGLNPAASGDVIFQIRFDEALKWFDDVERQRAHPNVIEATDPAIGYAAPAVLSRPLQGWIPPRRC